MLESFGARLRKHREAQQIALDTIADQTKIKQSLLEGLEQNDLSHWPAGIYRRAYLRSYARAIHMDPDEVVRECAAAHPEPADTAAVAAALAAAAPAKSPGRLRSIFGSLGFGGAKSEPAGPTDIGPYRRQADSGAVAGDGPIEVGSDGGAASAGAAAAGPTVGPCRKAVGDGADRAGDAGPARRSRDELLPAPCRS